MEGMNVGGAGGFDAYLNLQPPGQERGGFANLNGAAGAGAPGGDQATATLAGHFGYSEVDTMGTHLDKVVEFAQQLNITFTLGSGSSDTVIQLYLNNLNPTLPTLPPIKFMMEISEKQLAKGDIAGAQIPKDAEAQNKENVKGKEQGIKGSGDESENPGTTQNQNQPFSFGTTNDSGTFQASTTNQGSNQGTTTSGNQSSGGKSVGATGSTDEQGPTYVNEAGSISPDGEVIPRANRITAKDLQDGSQADYLRQLNESSSQSANKTNEPFSFRTGDETGNTPGSANNSPTATEAGIQAGTALPGTVYTGDNKAAQNRVVGGVGASSAAAVDASDVNAKAHAGSTAGATAETTTNELDKDAKANTPYFNTREGAGGGDSGSSGGNSGQSRDQSGESIAGFKTLKGVNEDHAKVQNGLNASLDKAVDGLSAGNAADVATVNIIRPSGGNPWLAGNAFLQFQLAFNDLQRILMMNTVVQGRVELAGMKMNVDLAKQTSDAIMAIARMNMMVHIATAVMSAASMAISIGGLAGGSIAARGNTPGAQGRAGPFNETQWNVAGGMGAGLEKTSTSIVQAMTSTLIAEKEGMKEILQAYRTISQHIMDKATEAVRNNQDLISQLLQTKDKMVDSTQQAVAAALRK